MRDMIGERIKGYEHVSRQFLTRRTPTIIRLDGKAFHTFTRGLKRPFDNILIKSMQDTAKYLCENIQGCKIAYTQSDEISLLLTDYEKLTTDAWFDKNIQKIVSVSASMATLSFNRYFRYHADRFIKSGQHEGEGLCISELEDLCVAILDDSYTSILEEKMDTALFDSRVFNIPKEEVCNYFIWRQQDCTRNSIQMLGQSEFSQKELHGKSCDKIQELLLTASGINWNDLHVNKKRGSCIVKNIKDSQVQVNGKPMDIRRNIWELDESTPIFSKEREYIDKLI